VIKPIRDVGFVLYNASFFLLNNFLYNYTLVTLDVTPGNVGYVALSM